MKIIEFPFQELFMGRNWNSLPKSLFYPPDPQILNKINKLKKKKKKKKVDFGHFGALF